jgi:glycosidase
MKHFIATRKAHPVLGWGDCHFLTLENKAVLAYLRRTREAHMLIVCNLSGQAQTATLPLAAYAEVTPREVLTGRSLEPVRERYELSLEAYEYFWLEVGI